MKDAVPVQVNHPVEVVYPLRRQGGKHSPFPTIYWLGKGELHHAIADLERQGWVGKLEERMRNDADFPGFRGFREEVHADHARYRERRWAMLTQADRALVESAPSLLRSFRGGVAGIADFDHVKCLHAHVAHALADSNAIGRVVLEMAKRRDSSRHA